MQDLKHLSKIISDRKGITIEEASKIVNELIKGKTIFGAKLAINNYIDGDKTVGQTTIKGYHDIEPHERIKE
jgi:hypothetical protein